MRLFGAVIVRTGWFPGIRVAKPKRRRLPLAPPSTSGLAIASMVLGIMWIYWIGSITALVLGYLALREIRQNPHRIEGKGMAVAGIVLGWIGVTTLLLAIAMGVYVWKNERDSAPGDAGGQLTSQQVGLVGSGSGSQRGEAGFHAGGRGFVRGNGPKRGVGQQAAHQLGVQGMTRLVGLHASQQGQAR
jgi:uncharacterized protein DUF4190